MREGAISILKHGLFIFAVGAYLSSAQAHCVDITVGTKKLSVPDVYVVSGTRTKGNSSNLSIKLSFPSGCVADCFTPLVVLTDGVAKPPEEQWQFNQPRLTERKVEGFSVWLSRFENEEKVMREILVPQDQKRPSERFYWCVPIGQAPNPYCVSSIELRNGLVAQFYFPRSFLQQAGLIDNKARFILDRLDMNSTERVCK